MNIDQLIKDKIKILRNDQGKIVNGIAVEDLESVINEIKAQGIKSLSAKETDHVKKLICNEVSFFNGWAVSVDSMEKACFIAACKVESYLKRKYRQQNKEQ